MTDEGEQRLQAAKTARKARQTQERIRTLLLDVRTVGELVARLSTLPPDTPIYRGGNAGGSYAHGIDMRLANLARHRNEQDYVGDMDDPVWKKAKTSGFEEPFKALVL